jgi:hyperosmotically inducible protein
MKSLTLLGTCWTVLLVGTLTGCSGAPAKSPDVAGNVRQSLDQAGFKDVSVSQDRDKGVVTLSGHVGADVDKAQAESITKSFAGAQVVSDQVAVIPPGVESEAKAVNADLDQGIDKNLDAALIQSNLKKGVKYGVKNGVVTLTGEVNSQARRARVESMAAGVPHVQQVVNEMEVTNQKATSTN